jgi:hypothetical protein
MRTTQKGFASHADNDSPTHVKLDGGQALSETLYLHVKLCALRVVDLVCPLNFVQAQPLQLLLCQASPLMHCAEKERR